MKFSCFPKTAAEYAAAVNCGYDQSHVMREVKRREALAADSRVSCPELYRTSAKRLHAAAVDCFGQRCDPMQVIAAADIIRREMRFAP
jgi:hypothetical protein